MSSDSRFFLMNHLLRDQPYKKKSTIIPRERKIEFVVLTPYSGESEFTSFLGKYKSKTRRIMEKEKTLTENSKESRRKRLFCISSYSYEALFVKQSFRYLYVFTL